LKRLLQSFRRTLAAYLRSRDPVSSAARAPTRVSTKSYSTQVPQLVEVRLKSGATARATDNPNVLASKTLRMNKDASVAAIAAAAAAAVSSASPPPSLLLFPEIPGLLRPSSYALDPNPLISCPPTASTIIASVPPPLCLYWQPQALDANVRCPALACVSYSSVPTAFARAGRP
jgi:hypothetical protein